MSEVFSIIESPVFPNFSALYQRLGLVETKLTSVRKAITESKKRKPDYVVAEFIYGYSSHYSGVHISNLDSLLVSLQKYSPDTRMIVLVDKSERQYVDKLNAIMPLHAVYVLPVTAAQMEAVFAETG